MQPLWDLHGALKCPGPTPRMRTQQNPTLNHQKKQRRYPSSHPGSRGEESTGLSGAVLPLHEGDQACSQITPRWNQLYGEREGVRAAGLQPPPQPLCHRALSKEPKARAALIKPRFEENAASEDVLQAGRLVAAACAGHGTGALCFTHPIAPGAVLPFCPLSACSHLG